jgi:nucleoside-diphosphate kinase
MDKKHVEQTLVLIKPDALKNSITGFLLSQLSEYHTGSRFAAAKIVHVNKMLAQEHYAEHRGRPYYPSLIDYIMGRIHYPQEPWKRRVIAIVYHGPQALRKIREAAGPTNPHTAREERPGCIRALGTMVPIKDDEGHEIGDRMDNLIHASASQKDAEREIKLWFIPHDIPPLMRPYPTDVCDTHYYIKDGNLYNKHVPNSICLFAPADIAWKSDLQILRALSRNMPAQGTLNSVAAKYLINRDAVVDES